jgi:hypothetical protein
MESLAYDHSLRFRPTCTSTNRSKLLWITLPAGVPSSETYYQSQKVWPAASLEQRRTVFGLITWLSVARLGDLGPVLGDRACGISK